MILCLKTVSLTRKCLQSIYNTEWKLNKYADNSNTRHKEVPGERFINTVLDPIWDWEVRVESRGWGWGGGSESGLMGESEGHLAEFNICGDKVTMVKEDCLRQRK